ncbi:MAG: diguanylate cyclase [Spirochaetales bacterium]|nr:diguanylate cyclase [Spirochaetales bacterium]
MLKSPADLNHLGLFNHRAWEDQFYDPAAVERTTINELAEAEAIGSLKDEIEAILRLATARIVLTDFRRAASDLQDVLTRVDLDTIDGELSCNLHMGLGAALHGQWEISRAVASYRESLSIAERADLTYCRIAGLCRLGEVEMDLGHISYGRDLFLQAAALLREHPDDSSEMIILRQLGGIALIEGNEELAFGYLTRSREIAVTLEDPFNQSALLALLSTLEVRRGNTNEAARLEAESVQRACDIRSPSLRCAALMHCGDVYRHFSRGEVALGFYRRARDLALRAPVRHLLYHLHERIAQMHEEQRELPQALESYKRYVELKETIEEEWTEHRMHELSKRMEVDRLEVVSEIAREITSSLDLDDILDGLYQRVNRILDAELFSIALYDHEADALDYQLVIHHGRRGEPIRIDGRDENSFSAWVVRNRKPVIIDDLRSEYRHFIKTFPSSASGGEKRSAIYLPLIVKDRLIGVLSVQTSRVGAYSNLDIRMVRTLASFLGIAIDNALILDRVTLYNRLVVQEKDELRQAYERISRVANRDHLTGLANRRMFQEILTAQLQSRQDGTRPLALLYIDLDDFKPINDTYGHEAGDDVLRAVAKRLREGTRSDDLVARVGGDEFIIMLHDIADEEAVAKRVAKLHEILHEPIAIGDGRGQFSGEVTISVSTGTALFPRDGTTYEQLVRLADHSMYGAKRARNEAQSTHSYEK